MKGKKMRGEHSEGGRRRWGQLGREAARKAR